MTVIGQGVKLPEYNTEVKMRWLFLGFFTLVLTGPSVVGANVTGVDENLLLKPGSALCETVAQKDWRSVAAAANATSWELPAGNTAPFAVIMQVSTSWVHAATNFPANIWCKVLKPGAPYATKDSGWLFTTLTENMWGASPPAVTARHLPCPSGSAESAAWTGAVACLECCSPYPNP